MKLPATLSFLVALTPALAAPQAKGLVEGIMSEAQTGIFGSGTGASSSPSFSIGGLVGMVGPVLGMTVDTTGGSGPYKASGGAIASFTRHTVFQPKMLPVGQKLPVILWGNGACSGNGQWFSKFLTEIASHGFVVIANGDPNGSLLSGTTAKDIPDAIEWVYQNAGTGNWTHLDKTRLAAAGQSCGGIQAYSASVDPRIKLTGIFNSGLIIAENQKYFDRLHAPVGYFLGGESDIAYLNGERDYKTLPAKIPTVKANLPVGHMATYGDQYGGKFGKAAVAFFKWQLKGDTAAGELFLNPATSSLTKDGWAIESKNWKRP